MSVTCWIKDMSDCFDVEQIKEKGACVMEIMMFRFQVALWRCTCQEVLFWWFVMSWVKIKHSLLDNFSDMLLVQVLLLIFQEKGIRYSFYLNIPAQWHLKLLNFCWHQNIIWPVSANTTCVFDTMELQIRWHQNAFSTFIIHKNVHSTYRLSSI